MIKCRGIKLHCLYQAPIDQAAENGGAMEFRRLRRKLNMIKAAALVSLAAALCLAGCSTTQPAAPSHTTTDTALPLEEMGKLCYYRDERDAQFKLSPCDFS